MNSNEDLDLILKSLKLGTASRRVYSELLMYGQSTASRLSSALDMPRPSVYDQLKLLMAKSLVYEKEIDGKAYFLAGGLSDIEDMLRAEAMQRVKALADFKEIKKSIKVTESRPARIKFYESRETIVKSLQSMLLSKSKVVYSLWPYEEMLAVLGRDILESINKDRVVKKIKLKVIWPSTIRKIKSHIWSSADHNLERRYSPKGYDFTMGYVLYDNKVTFISSKSEGYAFTVESEEFSRLMEAQFHKFWDSCN